MHKIFLFIIFSQTVRIKFLLYFKKMFTLKLGKKHNNKKLNNEKCFFRFKYFDEFFAFVKKKLNKNSRQTEKPKFKTKK